MDPYFGLPRRSFWGQCRAASSSPVLGDLFYALSTSSPALQSTDSRSALRKWVSTDQAPGLLCALGARRREAQRLER